MKIVSEIGNRWLKILHNEPIAALDRCVDLYQSMVPPFVGMRVFLFGSMFVTSNCNLSVYNLLTTH